MAASVHRGQAAQLRAQELYSQRRGKTGSQTIDASEMDFIWQVNGMAIYARYWRVLFPRRGPAALTRSWHCAMNEELPGSDGDRVTAQLQGK